MKIILYIILSVFLISFSAAAQTISKAPAVLRVEVENGQTLDLKIEDLAKLPRVETKAKDHDEKEHTFSGVNLRDVLKLAGAKIGNNQLRGKEHGNYLLVEAADNYRAVFGIAELDAEFTDKIVMLADSRDGEPLPEKNGRWQVVVPGEKKHGRWVRQVTALKIKRAQ